MRRFFTFILSFFILTISVGALYVAMKYGPLLQSSVLLPATQGTLGFQVEHEESFRINTPHKVTFSLQETEDKVIRTGYFDVTFDAGTAFLGAQSVEGSSIEVINTYIQQTKGYARIEVISRDPLGVAKLQDIALVTIQVEQVPANNIVDLGFEGVVTDDQIPPITNQVPAASVSIPVVHDATMLVAKEEVIARHVFDKKSANIGEIAKGVLSIAMPKEARSAKINLIYEPEYIEIKNIILNEELVLNNLLVDKKKGDVKIDVNLESLTNDNANFANIEYKALKDIEKTGISIAGIEIFADGETISTDLLEEVNDSENNLEIIEKSLVLEITEEEMVKPEKDEVVEEVNIKDLKNTCEFKDLTEIAKNKELSASQVQNIIDDICFVVEQGIMKGFSDGTFKPNGTIDRAAYAKVNTLLVWDEKAVTRANNPYIRGERSYTRVYKDFSSDEQWFYKYVISAKLLGIIKGYADGTYRPAKTINRAEAAKITTEAVGMNDSQVEAAVVIADQGDNWFDSYMNTIKSLLGESMLITVFPADGEVRRFEVAQLIANYLRFLER